MDENNFLIEASDEFNGSVEHFMDSVLLLFITQHKKFENENMFGFLQMILESVIMLQNLQARKHTFYQYHFCTELCMECTKPQLLNIYSESYKEIKNRIDDIELSEEKQFMIQTLFEEVEYLLEKVEYPLPLEMGQQTNAEEETMIQWCMGDNNLEQVWLSIK